MKNYFLAVFVILSLTCCRKKEEPPKEIYSRQQVALFLMDLYILESKLKMYTIPKDSSKKVFKYFEEKLFEKHNMNDSLYKISFNYYLNDPEGLTEIYSILVDSLSLRERLLQTNPGNEE